MKHEAGHLTAGEPRGAHSAENFMRKSGRRLRHVSTGKALGDLKRGNN